MPVAQRKFILSIDVKNFWKSTSSASEVFSLVLVTLGRKRASRWKPGVTNKHKMVLPGLWIIEGEWCCLAFMGCGKKDQCWSCKQRRPSHHLRTVGVRKHSKNKILPGTVKSESKTQNHSWQTRCVAAKRPFACGKVRKDRNSVSSLVLQAGAPRREHDSFCRAIPSAAISHYKSPNTTAKQLSVAKFVTLVINWLEDHRGQFVSMGYILCLSHNHSNQFLPPMFELKEMEHWNEQKGKLQGELLETSASLVVRNIWLVPEKSGWGRIGTLSDWSVGQQTKKMTKRLRLPFCSYFVLHCAYS